MTGRFEAGIRLRAINPPISATAVATDPATMYCKGRCGCGISHRHAAMVSPNRRMSPVPNRIVRLNNSATTLL